MKHRLPILAPLLVAGLAALVTMPARSMCVAAPTQVLTVTVTACESSLARWDRTAAVEGRSAFFHDQIHQAVHGQPGIVVSGTAGRSVAVDGGPDDFTVLGTAEQIEYEGEWFLALDPAAPEGEDSPCAAYPVGETVEIYSPPTCCDVLPPQDAVCALGVSAGVPVADAVRY